MMQYLGGEFFETVRASLNRTKTYHKNALSKFKRKKPKQSDIDKFLLHVNEVAACERALDNVVKAMYELSKDT